MLAARLRSQAITLFQSELYARAAHFFAHRSMCRRFSQNQNFLDAFWALSIHPKLKKLWNQRQYVQYFLGKVPRLPQTFPKCEPFNQKFSHSGANLNAERKLPDDNFRKFRYILRKCCSIRYCMEVAENLNQTF